MTTPTALKTSSISYTEAMETLSGNTRAALVGSSWLHDQWLAQAISRDEFVEIRTDPVRAKSFAVTHCAAAAALPSGFSPRPDHFSANDLFTRYTTVTWTCPRCQHPCTETVAELARRQPRGYTLEDVDTGTDRTVMCDRCRPADSEPEDQFLVQLVSYPEIYERISRRRLPGSTHRPDAVIDLPSGPLVIEYDGDHRNHDLQVRRLDCGQIQIDDTKVHKDERTTQQMIALDGARVMRFRMPTMPRLHLPHDSDKLLQFHFSSEAELLKGLALAANLVHVVVHHELTGSNHAWNEFLYISPHIKISADGLIRA